MVSLNGDRFMQSTTSSGNKFQSPMVAGKKDCLNVSVVQIGSFCDFKLLIHVFLVLKCRCVSACIAIRPFIILHSNERRCSRLLSASGFQPSWNTMLVTLLSALLSLSSNLAALRCTLSSQSMSFWQKGYQTVEEYSKIDFTGEA